MSQNAGTLTLLLVLAVLGFAIQVMLAWPLITRAEPVAALIVAAANLLAIVLITYLGDRLSLSAGFRTPLFVSVGEGPAR